MDSQALTILLCLETSFAYRTLDVTVDAGGRTTISSIYSSFLIHRRRAWKILHARRLNLHCPEHRRPKRINILHPFCYDTISLRLPPFKAIETIPFAYTTAHCISTYKMFTAPHCVRLLYRIGSSFFSLLFAFMPERDFYFNNSENSSNDDDTKRTPSVKGAATELWPFSKLHKCL